MGVDSSNINRGRHSIYGDDGGAHWRIVLSGHVSIKDEHCGFTSDCGTMLKLLEAVCSEQFRKVGL